MKTCMSAIPYRRGRRARCVVVEAEDYGSRPRMLGRGLVDPLAVADIVEECGPDVATIVLPSDDPARTAWKGLGFWVGMGGADVVFEEDPADAVNRVDLALEKDFGNADDVCSRAFGEGGAAVPSAYRTAAVAAVSSLFPKPSTDAFRRYFEQFRSWMATLP